MIVVDTKLANYLAENPKLINKSSIDELKGITLGVDLKYLIEHISLNVLDRKDRLINFLNDSDLFDKLSGLVLKFIKDLKVKYNINVFVVLSGLRNFSQWERIKNMDKTHGDNKFNGSFVDKLNKSQWINFFIKNDFFNYLVAPYTSLTQLVYMYSTGVINAIFGPTDLLMFNRINRIIVDISSTDLSTFGHLDKFELFKNLGIKQQLEFTELNLILKNSLQPVQFNITNINNEKFKKIVEINKKTPLKISFLNEKQQDLLEKAIMTLYAAPILTLSGQVNTYNLLVIPAESDNDEKNSAIIDDEEDEDLEDDEKFKYLTIYSKTPLKVIDPPSDSFEFLGKKIPNEIYFYQSLGLIDHLESILESICYGSVIDSTDVKTNETVLTKLIKDIKLKELKLIVNCMPKYFHKQNILYQNINKTEIFTFNLESLPASELKKYKRISFTLSENNNLKQFIEKNDFINTNFKKLSFHEAINDAESLIMTVFWRVLSNIFDFGSDIKTDDTENTISFKESKLIKTFEKIQNNIELFRTDQDIILFIIMNLIKQHLSATNEINFETINQFTNIFKESFETVLIWTLLTGDFDRTIFESTDDWKKSLVQILPLSDLLILDEKRIHLDSYITLL
ncbi:Protein MKT1 [Hanseniaspora uvarum]|uniref:Protein MKT1 n=1 Tax=Hanseniaspora uvarum TaxID=29833 RepID=A0A1E5RQ25_HANUV|nr:Protein MKT1 [Hanseniaspora uvarum]